MAELVLTNVDDSVLHHLEERAREHAEKHHAVCLQNRVRVVIGLCEAASYREARAEKTLRMGPSRAFQRRLGDSFIQTLGGSSC